MQQIHSWLNQKKVIVTGHTGFKGSWLTLWLSQMGAQVVGISLLPDQGVHNLFDGAAIGTVCDSHIQDIRDAEAVAAIFKNTQPELVFHLAAQPLVLPSYEDPLATFSTNIMGTANVLEAARITSSVRALVCVTTDKVYDNQELNVPFSEADKLGGGDPYSASKSAAEMVARAYMRSLVPLNGTLELATARGGNVIGGGDWAQSRIVPDVMRAWQAGRALSMRNPDAIRPWQHVLELCFGYILLAYRLEHGRGAVGRSHFRGEWNFGPEFSNEITVKELVNRVLVGIEHPDLPIDIQPSSHKEAHYLRLNSSKAKRELGWRPVLNCDETIQWTARWYKDYCTQPDIARGLMEEQTAAYEQRIQVEA